MSEAIEPKEPKMCPISMAPGDCRKFRACVQDKCEWWVEERDEPRGGNDTAAQDEEYEVASSVSEVKPITSWKELNDLVFKTVAVPGHCCVRDWGKR